VTTDLTSVPKKILLTFLAIATVAGVAIHTVNFANNAAETEQEPVLSLDSWQSLADEFERKIERFDGQVGFVLKDLKTGYTAKYNADILIPSASIVKIPIMAAVLQKVEDRQLEIGSLITLQRSDRVGGSGRLKYSGVGSKYTVSYLLHAMITQSDNTATQMLTRTLGFEYLEKYFKSLGLNNTNMVRGIMDLRARNRGIENYTTANDMVIILEKIYRKQCSSALSCEYMIDLMKQQHINDRLNSGLPKGWTVAHKTGLIRGVCHDVGIIFHPRGDFVIVVLLNKVNNYKTAKRFIGTLARVAFNYYDNGYELPFYTSSDN